MMGRQVASEAFLHAVARHDPAAELAVCAATRDDVSAFQPRSVTLRSPIATAVSPCQSVPAVRAATY